MQQSIGLLHHSCHSAGRWLGSIRREAYILDHDFIATRRVEDLMLELKEKYTIAIVTHNLQQAQRVADKTAFLFVDTTAGGRTGYLIEYRPSAELFEDPREERTKAYIRGEFS